MESTFTTVATFTYSSEAKIILGRLQAEGIQAFLRDDLTIDTDPLVSNAIGGVKLEVPTEEVPMTIEILETISQYSVSDTGNEIRCPNCDSNKIHFFSHVTNIKSLLAFLFGFVFGGLPFYTKYDYTCEVCKTKFVTT